MPRVNFHFIYFTALSVIFNSFLPVNAAFDLPYQNGDYLATTTSAASIHSSPCGSTTDTISSNTAGIFLGLMKIVKCKGNNKSKWRKMVFHKTLSNGQIKSVIGWMSDNNLQSITPVLECISLVDIRVTTRNASLNVRQDVDWDTSGAEEIARNTPVTIIEPGPPFMWQGNMIYPVSILYGENADPGVVDASYLAAKIKKVKKGENRPCLNY
jgi:hypothetical protein